MASADGKWALITGASSGFGVEFAKLLALSKTNLVLVARRIEPMNELAETLRRERGVQVVVIGLDLARAGAAAQLKADLDSRGIGINVLVNNAGYGMSGSFLDQPMEKIASMMQLNVMTLTELTHAFGRDMAKRGGGHILLMGSLLAFQAVPGYAAYAASKAYVLLLGEAMHQELAPRGVTVTTLCPGISATSFSEVAGQKLSPIIKMLMMEPRPVVKAGIRAMWSRKAGVVPGILNKATVFLDRLMPRSMQRRILGKIMAG